MGGVVVVVMAVLALSLRLIFATEYVVGEGSCTVALWSRDMTCNYNTWALLQDFAVGDTLVFNFKPGESNVAEVTKLDYDGCMAGQTPTNPKYVYSRSPATITLSTTGTFYFVSTVDFSCFFQQQLTVTVNKTLSDSPSVPGSPPSTPSSPSSPKPSHSPPPASSSSSGHHSSIVAPVVGSVVGFVLFVAKLSLAVYCIKRRQKKQQLNAQAAVPPQHGPTPALNLNNRVNVNVQEHNDIHHGIPVSGIHA